MTTDIRRRALEQTAVSALAGRLEGSAILPADPGYDRYRSAWNLSWDQRPAVIVVTASAADVAEAVRFAAERALGVAVQSTGHGLAAAADDALLIVTSAMDQVVIDPAARTAWIGAGATWGAVLDKAQDVGLAPLLGSSPGVGAVGYVLGGGFGWLGRKYGLGADSVRYFEVVTGRGRALRAGPDEHEGLYWALRGAGAGSLGVVTGMEVDLVPVTTVYAGNLYYPADVAAEVMARYREWIVTAPPDLTSSVVLMNYPPIDQIPEPVRGRSFVIVRGCHAGDPKDAADLLAFWREWRTPEMDVWGEMPFRAVETVSNDPVDPVPARGTGGWLAHLGDDAIEALVRFGLPRGSGPSPLTVTEVRHAGGAVTRGATHPSAVGNREATLLLQLIGMTPSPEADAALRLHTDALRSALGPEAFAGAYPNFLEGEEKRSSVAAAVSAEALRRLRNLKERHDPAGLFRFGLDLSAASHGR